jgi:hypothetical protein
MAAGLRARAHGYVVRTDPHGHMYPVKAGGLSDHTYSGGLALRTTWSNVTTWGHLSAGSASSWVDTASWALLADGFVCYSAGPDSDTTIF